MPLAGRCSRGRTIRRFDLYLASERWQEAAAEMAGTVEREPHNEIVAMRGAALFLLAGDDARYRRHCRFLLRHFATTTRATSAERIAKACLLAPAAADDLAAVGRLTDVALQVSAADWHFPYTRLVRAMAAYRAGDFAGALDWLDRSQASSHPLDATSQGMRALVRALILHHLKRPHEAREEFAKAHRIVKIDFVNLQRGSLSGSWHDVLINRLLYREAESLLSN